jgi:hypothetical protein
MDIFLLFVHRNICTKKKMKFEENPGKRENQGGRGWEPMKFFIMALRIYMYKNESGVGISKKKKI